MSVVVRVFLSLIILIQASASLAQFKLYEKGHDSYAAGKHDAAIAYFSEYLTKATRDKTIDIDVFYLRALSYYKTHKFAESIPDFEETILRGHTNKGNIYWFMAKAYAGLSQHDEAVNSYGNAYRELKSSKEAISKILHERSELHKKMGNNDQAAADLKEAIALHQGNTSHMQKELDRIQAPAAESRKTGRSEKPKEEPKKEQTLPKEERVAAAVPVQNTQPSLSPLAEFYKDERRFALVIGNSNYPKDIGILRNPVNDANDMAQELRDSHFEVQLLTNATYGQIRAALMKFKEKLDAGDPQKTVGLFYFAGHGLQFDQENYLVPVDAAVEFNDDIPRYCFPIQRMVLSNMERSNSRMNIVILDACRNNPFPSLNRSVGGSGLGEMQRARGSFIAYATAPGSVASDGPGRNGLYTQELLRALKKPGLTIEQVFKEVRANVLQLSNNRQNTWESSNILGEFHFKY